MKRGNEGTASNWQIPQVMWADACGAAIWFCKQNKKTKASLYVVLKLAAAVANGTSMNISSPSSPSFIRPLMGGGASGRRQIESAV